MRGAHLLKHWATTQKAITLSSGEAELTGVVKGVAEGLGMQSLLQDLGESLSSRSMQTVPPRLAYAAGRGSAGSATLPLANSGCRRSCERGPSGYTRWPERRTRLIC